MEAARIVERLMDTYRARRPADQRLDESKLLAALEMAYSGEASLNRAAIEHGFISSNPLLKLVKASDSPMPPNSGRKRKNKTNSDYPLEFTTIPLLAREEKNGFEDPAIFQRLEKASGYKFWRGEEYEKLNRHTSETDQSKQFQGLGPYIVMVRDGVDEREAKKRFAKKMQHPPKKFKRSKYARLLSHQVKSYQRYILDEVDEMVPLHDVIHGFFPDKAERAPITCEEDSLRFVGDETLEHIGVGHKTGTIYIKPEGLYGFVKSITRQAELFVGDKAILPEDFDNVVEAYPDWINNKANSENVKQRGIDGAHRVPLMNNLFMDLMQCSRIDLLRLYPEFKGKKIQQPDVVVRNKIFSEEMGIKLKTSNRMHRDEFMERCYEWMKGFYIFNEAEAGAVVQGIFDEQEGLSQMGVEDLLSLSYPAYWGGERHFRPEELDRQIGYMLEATERRDGNKLLKRLGKEEPEEEEVALDEEDFNVDDYLAEMAVSY